MQGDCSWRVPCVTRAEAYFVASARTSARFVLAGTCQGRNHPRLSVRDRLAAVRPRNPVQPRSVQPVRTPASKVKAELWTNANHHDSMGKYDALPMTGEQLLEGGLFARPLAAKFATLVLRRGRFGDLREVAPPTPVQVGDNVRTPSAPQPLAARREGPSALRCNTTR